MFLFSYCNIYAESWHQLFKKWLYTVPNIIAHECYKRQLFLTACMKGPDAEKMHYICMQREIRPTSPVLWDEAYKVLSIICESPIAYAALYKRIYLEHQIRDGDTGYRFVLDRGAIEQYEKGFWNTLSSEPYLDYSERDPQYDELIKLRMNAFLYRDNGYPQQFHYNNQKLLNYFRLDCLELFRSEWHKQCHEQWRDRCEQWRDRCEEYRNSNFCKRNQELDTTVLLIKKIDMEL
jgi:hypothetical protein